MNQLPMLMGLMRVGVMQMSKIYLLIDYGYNGYEIVSCNKSDFKKIQYFYNELNRLNYLNTYTLS